MYRTNNQASLFGHSFKTQPMQYVPLDLNEIFKCENEVMKITRKIEVDVVNTIEQEFVDAIVKAADEAGVTDLYLIDKEFIVSAIQHEKERRGLV